MSSCVAFLDHRPRQQLEGRLRASKTAATQDDDREYFAIFRNSCVGRGLVGTTQLISSTPSRRYLSRLRARTFSASSSLQRGFSHKNLPVQCLTTASFEESFLSRLSTTDGSERERRNESRLFPDPAFSAALRRLALWVLLNRIKTIMYLIYLMILNYRRQFGTGTMV